MNEMTSSDRAAYLAKRDAAVASALSQVSAAAPSALADAGRHAALASETRPLTLRAHGPAGIRKAALEMVVQEGLTARAELDAILAEEARAAEMERAAAEEAARIAAARAARPLARAVDFVRRKVRR